MLFAASDATTLVRVGEWADWVGAGAGVAGAIVAVVAVFVAGNANRRATEANEIAERALDLEARVDERQREFRAVEWRLRADQQDGRYFLRLWNIGYTEACNVTLVLFLDPDSEVHALGKVYPGERGRIESPLISEWLTDAAAHEVVHPGFRVHWSSPLGYVSDVTYRLSTLADFMD